MKNISRRVFIKGLAVAGVAAAASTVLAGCNTNMIPGVDDGADDDTNEGTTGNVQTVTFTDQSNDKTLTLNITKVDFNTLMNQAVLAVTVKNELGEDLSLQKAAATTGKNYGLMLTCTGENANGVPLSTAPAVVASTTTGSDNLFTASVNAVDGTPVSGVLVLDTKTDKWAKITVTATLTKVVAAAGTTKVQTIAVEKFEIKNA